MRKLLLILSIIFTVLTFAGGGYVIVNHGTVNAGYAVIPMLFALVCLVGLKSLKKKD